MSDQTASELSNLRSTAIFSTPLFTHRWKEEPHDLEFLRERILAHKDSAGGVAKSNRGGWHSEIGELEFCGEMGRLLVRRMRALADEATRQMLAADNQPQQQFRWSVTAWANVNQRGDFNAVHAHPGSTWSGTYYVDAGDAGEGEAGASLQLFDPCSGRSVSYPTLAPTCVYIRPNPGLMILFPSYVPHMVFPHEGSGTRISIAFNLSGEAARLAG